MNWSKSFKIGIGIVAIGLGLIFTNSCTKDVLEQKRNFDRNEMLANIADNAILPYHLSFIEQTENLKTETENFSNNPSLNSLANVQEAWKSAVQVWRICELFNLGPIQSSYVHNKIDESPSNTTFIDNHIYGSGILDESYIENIGSNAKGIPALEYLLFNLENGNQTVIDSFTISNYSSRRMEYTIALSQNLHSKAIKLHNIWAAEGDNYYTEFIQSEGSDLGSSISMLANQMVTLIERVVQTKLGKPLGKASNMQGHPELVEALASGQSLQNIKDNLRSLELAFSGITTANVDGLGLDDYLDALKAKHDEETLPIAVKHQFELSYSALEEINEPLAVAVINDYQTVDNAYNELRNLLILLKVDVANNLAVTITFNDNDGD